MDFKKYRIIKISRFYFLQNYHELELDVVKTFLFTKEQNYAIIHYSWSGASYLIWCCLRNSKFLSSITELPVFFMLVKKMSVSNITLDFMLTTVHEVAYQSTVQIHLIHEIIYTIHLLKTLN